MPNKKLAKKFEKKGKKKKKKKDNFESLGRLW